MVDQYFVLIPTAFLGTAEGEETVGGGGIDCISYFITYLNERYLAELRLELPTLRLAVRRAADCTMEVGNFTAYDQGHKYMHSLLHAHNNDNYFLCSFIILNSQFLNLSRRGSVRFVRRIWNILNTISWKKKPTLVGTIQWGRSKSSIRLRMRISSFMLSSIATVWYVSENLLRLRAYVGCIGRVWNHCSLELQASLFYGTEIMPNVRKCTLWHVHPGKTRISLRISLRWAP